MSAKTLLVRLKQVIRRFRVEVSWQPLFSLSSSSLHSCSREKY
jgi:hypothetical protein